MALSKENDGIAAALHAVVAGGGTGAVSVGTGVVSREDHGFYGDYV
jgi:hypothetical protein